MSEESIKKANDGVKAGFEALDAIRNFFAPAQKLSAYATEVGKRIGDLAKRRGLDNPEAMGGQSARAFGGMVRDLGQTPDKIADAVYQAADLLGDKIADAPAIGKLALQMETAYRIDTKTGLGDLAKASKGALNPAAFATSLTHGVAALADGDGTLAGEILSRAGVLGEALSQRNQSLSPEMMGGLGQFSKDFNIGASDLAAVVAPLSELLDKAAKGDGASLARLERLGPSEDLLAAFSKDRDAGMVMLFEQMKDRSKEDREAILGALDSQSLGAANQLLNNSDKLAPYIDTTRKGVADAAFDRTMLGAFDRNVKHAEQRDANRELAVTGLKSVGDGTLWGWLADAGTVFRYVFEGANKLIPSIVALVQVFKWFRKSADKDGGAGGSGGLGNITIPLPVMVQNWPHCLCSGGDLPDRDRKGKGKNRGRGKGRGGGNSPPDAPKGQQPWYKRMWDGIRTVGSDAIDWMKTRGAPVAKGTKDFFVRHGASLARAGAAGAAAGGAAALGNFALPHITDFVQSGSATALMKRIPGVNHLVNAYTLGTAVLSGDKKEMAGAAGGIGGAAGGAAAGAAIGTLIFPGIGTFLGGLAGGIIGGAGGEWLGRTLMGAFEDPKDGSFSWSKLGTVALGVVSPVAALGGLAAKAVIDMAKSGPDRAVLGQASASGGGPGAIPGAGSAALGVDPTLLQKALAIIAAATVPGADGGGADGSNRPLGQIDLFIHSGTQQVRAVVHEELTKIAFRIQDGYNPMGRGY